MRSVYERKEGLLLREWLWRMQYTPDGSNGCATSAESVWSLFDFLLVD